MRKDIDTYIQPFNRLEKPTLHSERTLINKMKNIPQMPQMNFSHASYIFFTSLHHSIQGGKKHNTLTKEYAENIPPTPS